VTQACLLAPNCDAVVVWGFDDAHSWIPGSIPGADARRAP
jgi:GH35 family endo-1,4-beta-xylanase